MAKQIAQHLNVPNFKGSCGWLDKWKKRYNVKRLKLVMNQVKYQGKQFLPGMRDSLKLLVIIQMKTYGI